MTGAETGWVEDVRLMARRMALMYHFIAEALVETLGEERAAELIEAAIKRYGRYCGEVVRDEVLRRGLELTEENFSSVPDLPSKGWELCVVEQAKGERRIQVTFCPLAKVWLEMATPLARLHCLVDQAKYEGYNPDFRCIHTRNVLDGDGMCELVVTKRECRSGSGPSDEPTVR